MYSVKANLNEVQGVGYVKADDSLKKLSDYEDEITDYLKPLHVRFNFSTTSSTYVTALTVTGAGVLTFLQYYAEVIGVSIQVTIDGLVYESSAANSVNCFWYYRHEEGFNNDEWMKFWQLTDVTKEFPVINIPFKSTLLIQMKSDGSNLAKLKGIYSHGT